MAHIYATIPSPETEYSVGWAKRLVQTLREIFAQPVHLDVKTVASLPPASSVETGTLYFVSDEAGGAQPAFSDGTNWRRFTDRNIVS